MPGMNSGLNSNNPVLLAAFRAALLHQGIIALIIFAVLAMTWVSVREWLPSSARLTGSAGQDSQDNPGSQASQAGAAQHPPAEPAWRQLLRISFGLFWIFDGLLQAQPAMAAALPSRVIEPTAASSPGWVQHLVNWAGTTWSYHPIQAGASAVWIQVGIGAWLLAGGRGPWSRLAGLAGVGWGLVVWVFGESFGGIFAPGLTWLFGAPGAVVFYCAAGALIALPERYWRTPLLGRSVLAVMGLFFVGMAVLQAWPGRGFWQGTLHGRPGTLTGMIRSMVGTPQPALLSGWISGLGSFVEAHGFAVNLFVVVALAAIGAGLLSAGLLSAGPLSASPAGRRPRLLRPTIIFMIALCLADWVLVEDLGFLGGLGTDLNSMIPMVLVVVAGYLALTRAPAAAMEPAMAAGAVADPRPGGLSWRDRVRPGRMTRAFGTASTRTVLSAWAIAVIILGAMPMAMAQASPNADPIIAQAIDGSNAPLNFKAPAFRLTDQNRRQVSLASLHGKVVLLTFLDPVCVSDCPLIAQEFREADQVLGTRSRNVELVAIVANPLYRSVAYTRAFDQQEHLTGLPNWLFLTGTLPQLRQAWHDYSVAADITPAGGMIAHSDVAYVIDANGRTRTELDVDPGPGTASSKSSFAVELSDAAEQVMRLP
jgi:cytochrome oxidase Cu insertion factor (SCO1/SenC/PrrC family)